MYVLSGGKCSFKTTFLAGGQQALIKIKPDYREATLLLSGSVITFVVSPTHSKYKYGGFPS